MPTDQTKQTAPYKLWASIGGGVLAVLSTVVGINIRYVDVQLGLQQTAINQLRDNQRLAVDNLRNYYTEVVAELKERRISEDRRLQRQIDGIEDIIDEQAELNREYLHKEITRITESQTELGKTLLKLLVEQEQKQVDDHPP